MLLDKVKEVIAETMGISEDVIDLDSDLIDDLGADSIDAVELSIALEEAFDLDVTDEAITQFKTVADIVQYIEDQGEQ